MHLVREVRAANQSNRKVMMQLRCATDATPGSGEYLVWALASRPAQLVSCSRGRARILTLSRTPLSPRRLCMRRLVCGMFEFVSVTQREHCAECFAPDSFWRFLAVANTKTNPIVSGDLIAEGQSRLLPFRRWGRLVIHLREQRPHRRPQGFSNLLRNENRRHSNAAFEHGNVRPMKAGGRSECLLRHAGCFTSSTNHDPEQFC